MVMSILMVMMIAGPPNRKGGLDEDGDVGTDDDDGRPLAGPHIEKAAWMKMVMLVLMMMLAGPWPALPHIEKAA